jgi:cytochrome c peroxidase
MKYRLFIVALTSVLIAMLGVNSCKPKVSQDYRWNLPAGFPKPLLPSDNPMSDAKVTLGRHLFYDSKLSFNQQSACSTCHQQAFAFAEERQTSTGTTGKRHRRNSQTLVNVAYNGHLTWAHPGLKVIEQQILIPMFSEDPIELGITGHEQQVLERFSLAPYPDLFYQAFGQEQANFDHIVKALASFVRSLLSFDSPFDRYAYGEDDSAMTDSAKRGMDLFFSEKLECFHCHGGFNFSQSSQHENQRLDLSPFHNTGLYNEGGAGAYPELDQGIKEITLKDSDMGRYRAPTLRNVAVSAPYMHDGSLQTLSQVIDFYAAGGREQGITSPLKSPFVQGFALNEQDKQDMLNFLKSLTDKRFLNNPQFAAPDKAG